MSLIVCLCVFRKRSCDLIHSDTFNTEDLDLELDVDGDGNTDTDTNLLAMGHSLLPLEKRARLSESSSSSSSSSVPAESSSSSSVPAVSSSSSSSVSAVSSSGSFGSLIPTDILNLLIDLKKYSSMISQLPRQITCLKVPSCFMGGHLITSLPSHVEDLRLNFHHAVPLPSQLRRLTCFFDFMAPPPSHLPGPHPFYPPNLKFLRVIVRNSDFSSVPLPSSLVELHVTCWKSSQLPIIPSGLEILDLNSTGFGKVFKFQASQKPLDHLRELYVPPSFEFNDFLESVLLVDDLKMFGYNSSKTQFYHHTRFPSKLPSKLFKLVLPKDFYDFPCLLALPSSLKYLTLGDYHVTEENYSVSVPSPSLSHLPQQLEVLYIRNYYLQQLVDGGAFSFSSMSYLKELTLPPELKVPLDAFPPHLEKLYFGSRCLAFIPSFPPTLKYLRLPKFPDVWTTKSFVNSIPSMQSSLEALFFNGCILLDRASQSLSPSASSAPPSSSSSSASSSSSSSLSSSSAPPSASSSFVLVPPSSASSSSSSSSSSVSVSVPSLFTFSNFLHLRTLHWFVPNQQPWLSYFPPLLTRLFVYGDNMVPDTVVPKMLQVVRILNEVPYSSHFKPFEAFELSLLTDIGGKGIETPIQ